MNFEKALCEYFVHSKGLRSKARPGIYMIVEDIEAEARLCTQYLKDAGQESFWIDSVQKARDYFDENGTEGISCVILDYFLGYETGEDLVRYMDENGFYVPIFLYTGCEEVVIVIEDEMPFLTPLQKGDKEKFFEVLGLDIKND